jgi:hypothetical protein
MRKSLRISLMAILMLSPGAAAAQTLIDGSRVTEIVSIARGFGAAALLSQSNGSPKISGSINRMGYAVYFVNCDENHVCGEMNFYAGFLDIKPDVSDINAWNSTKRFGRAYLDGDGDASIEMDINLSGGISRDNLISSFEIWRLVLRQYAEHMGFQ